MLDTLSRVVKVERSTTEALNLRRIFGLTCGEIRGLHNSDFIEFADAAAARRALALNADGVRVLNVASQPCLIDQYRVVNPSAFNLDVSSISNTRSNTLVSTTGFNPTSDIEISAPSGLHCSPPSRHLLHSLKTCDSPISQSMTSPPAIVSSSSEHGASTRPIEMPGPSIQSRVISMRLCGETISLDLKTLTGEPASVIELLRMTSSDRGNWMTVGAYYRHIAHPEASRSVLSAMLEVFEQPDTSTHDLNPVFLLLSGCEMDLNKAARRKGNAAKADEHLKNAQNWLQRVYGTFSQSLLIGPSLGEKTEPVSIPTAPRSLSRSRNTSPGLPSRPTSDSRIFEREMQLLQESWKTSWKRKDWFVAGFNETWTISARSGTEQGASRTVPSNSWPRRRNSVDEQKNVSQKNGNSENRLNARWRPGSFASQRTSLTCSLALDFDQFIQHSTTT
ncbi:unnamed protein product [Mycena citricolor]|uniref:Uncharacterized protein n=1 Tax=Mycena citricolor TaxID=2018698 RepID=A0AAD2K6R3_9AGAR|nr:unnamed protein product [Mycena citricolor]